VRGFTLAPAIKLGTSIPDMSVPARPWAKSRVSSVGAVAEKGGVGLQRETVGHAGHEIANDALAVD
jgi:hypothetical protein